MDKVVNQLIGLLKEKWIVKDILDMKYEMEHREKMKRICKSINEMTCVILNTTEEFDIREERDIHTQIIFHEKLETSIRMEEAIEYYIFDYQPYEINQYRYINRIIEHKGEPYLNKQEYLNLYNID